MKFIHTSDWHLGKIIFELSLLDDQRYVLNRFLEQIDEEKPDAIIIAGDLYDRAVPNKEAINLLDEVLHAIVKERKIPVLAISGNHDSGDRLEFSSRLLKENGLYIAGKMKKEIEKVTMKDAYGNIHFYLIPFAYVSEMRHLYDEDTIRTFDEAFKYLLNALTEEMDANERNVVITHGFVINTGEDIEVSESVRPLAVGNVDYIDVSYFEAFDYVALGHLHRPSKVKYDHIRYSGSLMKYSFSEVNQKKGITIVEIKEKGNIEIYQKALETKRDMKVIEGKLADLIHTDYASKIPKNTYIRAVLTDEDPIYDAIGKLRSVYPNILRLDYRYNRIDEKNKQLATTIKEKKSDVQLFKSFYTEMTGKAFTETKEEIVTELFQNLLEGGEKV